MQSLHLFLLSILVLSSFFVLVSSNPVHSVLFLVFTIFNASLILFFFNVEFLALIFIIVYVGAIAVLFLFVIIYYCPLPLKVDIIRGAQIHLTDF